MRLWVCRARFAGRPALAFCSDGEATDLLKVVDVVAGHGFYDGPEGHGAAFGVGGTAVAGGLGDGVGVEKVPGAGGLGEGHRGVELVGLVTLCPGVLVGGLDDGGGVVE